MTLAFIPLDGRSLSQLSLMPVGSYILYSSPSKKGMRLPDHLFFQIMFKSCSCGAGAPPRRRPAWGGTAGPTGAASLRRRAARRWPASPGAQRAQGYRAAPQWGRMVSGSGRVVYRRFRAQCRLRSVGFTTSRVVCITKSFRNTPSQYLRVWKLKRRASETQPSALLSSINCPTITQPCSTAGWDDVPNIFFFVRKKST